MLCYWFCQEQKDRWNFRVVENMTNYNLSEEQQYVKRRRVLAAIAEDVVNSDEEDDSATETLNICDIIEDHQHEENGSAAAIRALGETIRNTLLEIHEARERNRDRRHSELLEVISRFANNQKHQDLQSEEEHSGQHQQRQADEFVLANVNAEKIETSDSIARFENTTTSELEITSKVCKQSPNVATKSAGTILNSNASLVRPSRKQSIELVATLKRDPVKNSILSRANMLEMQRIKMEDRERKKRELHDIKKL